MSAPNANVRRAIAFGRMMFCLSGCSALGCGGGVGSGGFVGGCQAGTRF